MKVSLNALYYLNIQSPSSGNVWEGIECIALFEEVCHWSGIWGFKIHPIPSYCAPSHPRFLPPSLLLPLPLLASPFPSAICLGVRCEFAAMAAVPCLLSWCCAPCHDAPGLTLWNYKLLKNPLFCKLPCSWCLSTAVEKWLRETERWFDTKCPHCQKIAHSE